MKKRVGILYICTGRYDRFWEPFYLSAQSYFMKNADVEVEYYVFTDAQTLYNEDNDTHIHRIYQANLGWPDNTLKRFHMFTSIADRLRVETEYVYFFNANLVFKMPVGMEILPDEESNGLVGTIHPGFWDMTAAEFTYDRNPRCRAFIPMGEGNTYFAGGLNGGRTADFLLLCETIRERVDADALEGITALWHDESHINRYFLDNPPKALSPAYLYPYNYNMPFEMKIEILDKSLLGGHGYLRGEQERRGKWSLGRWFREKLSCKLAK